MFEKTLTSLVGLLAASMLYMLLVMMPMVMIAEAECLKLGYPQAKVTYNLERYCVNLEGSTLSKVHKL